MKKLMFATALVASAAAFADPINAISFEGYDLTLQDLTVGNKVDQLEQGGNGNPYFCYNGDTDGSTVKSYGGDNLVAPSSNKRPAYFAQANNANYLELSTEGGTLWRSINVADSSGSTYLLGAATNVAATGTYFDSLVQFTPTEDGGGPTDLDAADKLAIWLNVDSSGGTPVTNLMVLAKTYVVDTENQALTASVVTNSLVVQGITITDKEWYRLTVKAIPNLLINEDYGKVLGFQIFIDGQPAKNTAGQTFNASEFYTYEMITEEMRDYMTEGSVFASLAALGNSTLQGVGFKGSGAIDDIVWTEENPFAGSGAAWIDEVTNIFVGVNLDATEKAKITAWATANNITVASGSEELAAAAYLLNLTSLPAGIPDLTITSIEEGEDANEDPAWILTVAASVNDTALALPAQINGAVMLKQSATLAGLDSANAATATFTIANGTATVTVTKDDAAAKFMKVSVGIAPPANAQQE